VTWTETFNCDICGKQKGSVDHWWLAWTEPYSPHAEAPERQMFKIYPWENMMAHDATGEALWWQAVAKTGGPLAQRGNGRRAAAAHPGK
jgi:hypothetical protein